MPPLICLWTLGVLLLVSTSHSYDRLDSIPNNLLRELYGRMDGPPLSAYYDDYHPSPDGTYFPDFEPAKRDIVIGREPSIRDKEYLQHSTLMGHQTIQGGAGEGHQWLKPDGSVQNVKVLKSDTLPSYCNAPNPCPLGYKAEDGCLEEFENTAAFSRDYQAKQDCMCDSEHMFDCPGASRDNEIDALARSLDNQGLAGATLDRLFQDMETVNPYLEGEKLPVVAKKAPSK